MWFLVIFIICAFLLFFFAIRADNKRKGGVGTKTYVNIHDKTILQTEFPRRKQMLEESVRLIQETSNIETLVSRYEVALEHYHWIMEQKSKGLPLFFESEDEGFESALNRINNYHIVRIAMEVFINYKKKMYGLKTVKAKDSNTAKMFEHINKSIELLKDHSNRDDSLKKLNRLHNNIEDFYSKISLE